MQKKLKLDKRFVNKIITKRIISLHDMGYTVDFKLGEKDNDACIEEEHITVFREFSLMSSEICYDRFSRSYKYLHAIETPCGIKGLLLTEKQIIGAILED